MKARQTLLALCMVALMALPLLSQTSNTKIQFQNAGANVMLGTRLLQNQFCLWMYRVQYQRRANDRLFRRISHGRRVKLPASMEQRDGARRNI
jgi:hypothetical protein